MLQDDLYQQVQSADDYVKVNCMSEDKCCKYHLSNSVKKVRLQWTREQENSSLIRPDYLCTAFLDEDWRSAPKKLFILFPGRQLFLNL